MFPPPFSSVMPRLVFTTARLRTVLPPPVIFRPPFGTGESYQRRAAESRLCCAVDNYRLCNFRQGGGVVDLHRAHADLELDRVQSGGCVGIDHRLAQAARTGIEVIRNRKNRARCILLLRLSQTMRHNKINRQRRYDRQTKNPICVSILSFHDYSFLARKAGVGIKPHA